MMCDWRGGGRWLTFPHSMVTGGFVTIKRSDENLEKAEKHDGERTIPSIGIRIRGGTPRA